LRASVRFCPNRRSRSLDDSLRLGHDAQQVLAQNLSDIGLAVTLSQQGLGDAGEPADIFHPLRHCGSIEVGSERNMIDSGEADDAIDVVHDLFPRDRRRRTKLPGDFRLPPGFVLLPGILRDEPRHQRLDPRLVVVAGLIQIRDVEVDGDDAALGRERLDHDVAHVADVAGDRAGRRVRGNHWRLTDLERVLECLVGHVRDIDEHAKPVHLPDHLPPELREAVVPGRLAGRVRPVGMVEVREGHVTDAQLREHPKDRQAVVDHVATLDADERGNSSLLMGTTDLVGFRAEDDLVRQVFRQLVHGGDLHERVVNRPGTGDRAGLSAVAWMPHDHAEEQRIESPLPDAGQIGVS
jgi:hypothetical protein